MKIYDITHEILSAPKAPVSKPIVLEKIDSIANGAPCNVSMITAEVHSGTHCDAPLHFFEDGIDIASMDPALWVGDCYVIDFTDKEIIGKSDLEGKIPDGVTRLLLKAGDAGLTPDGAEYLISLGITTIGTESLTVGPTGHRVNPDTGTLIVMDDNLKTHRILLGNGIAIIEGLVLKEVNEGNYFLLAQAIKIKGSDGAFCRALLLE